MRREERTIDRDQLNGDPMIADDLYGHRSLDNQIASIIFGSLGVDEIRVMYPTERVKKVVTLVARQVKARLGRTSQVIWFGSWIKGSARRTSDIDLAISRDGGVPQSEYARLVAWIDEDLDTLYPGRICAS